MSRRLTIAAATLAFALCTAGCSGDDASDGPDTSKTTQIPTSWINDTKKGWPKSDGFGSTIPVYDAHADCLLADAPTLMSTETELTDAGWGPFGDTNDDPASFRYACNYYAEDSFTASLELIKSADSASEKSAVADFKSTESTSVQDNTVTTETVGDSTVYVLQRWYPTNPQGAYLALYDEPKSRATVILTLGSLSKKDFKNYSPHKAAEQLITLLQAG